MIKENSKYIENKRSYALFKCDSCGAEFKRRMDNKNHETCKPCTDKLSGLKRKTHGLNNKNSRLHVTWANMKRRRVNPTKKELKNYGENLYLYDKWHDFIPFMEWALSNGYDDKKTIDRKNTNKGYFPENCRFVDYSIQNANKRITDKNKTGYLGVHKARDGKYVASVQWKGKQNHIGRFKNKAIAAIARDKYIIDNKLPHTLNFEDGILE